MLGQQLVQNRSVRKATIVKHGDNCLVRYPLTISDRPRLFASYSTTGVALDDMQVSYLAVVAGKRTDLRVEDGVQSEGLEDIYTPWYP